MVICFPFSSHEEGTPESRLSLETGGPLPWSPEYGLGPCPRTEEPWTPWPATLWHFCWEPHTIVQCQASFTGVIKAICQHCVRLSLFRVNEKSLFIPLGILSPSCPVGPLERARAGAAHLAAFLTRQLCVCPSLRPWSLVQLSWVSSCFSYALSLSRPQTPSGPLP